jgi:hypothetical protein
MPEVILGVRCEKFVPWLMHQANFCFIRAEERRGIFVPISEKRLLAKPAAVDCFYTLGYEGFLRIRTGRG